MRDHRNGQGDQDRAPKTRYKGIAVCIFDLRTEAEQSARTRRVAGLCRRMLQAALGGYLGGALSRESTTDELVTCREILEIRPSTAVCCVRGVLAPLLLLRMDRHARREEYNEAVSHLDALATHVDAKLRCASAGWARGLRRDMALILATKALLEESKGDLQRALGHSKQATQEACGCGHKTVEKLVLHLHARIIESRGDAPTAAAIRAFAGNWTAAPGADADPILDPRLWDLYQENINEEAIAA